MRIMAALIAILLFESCAAMQGMIQGMGMEPVDLNDGTWSRCEYTKPNGTFYWAHVPNSIAPQVGTEQPDGTVVACKALPRIPALKVEGE